MNARVRNAAVIVALSALLPATGLALAGSAPKGKTATATPTATTTATSTTTTTTTPTATTPKGDAAHDAMMAEMMKYAMPGPQHAAIKNQEGTWNATVTSWVDGPQPITSTGTETSTMILGGRFLETKFTGTYMGQPYEGWGLTGFDNKASRVLTLWADNMSTNWMSLTGTMSDDGKTMTCSGSMDGPSGKPMDIRAETKFDSDTQMTYTMFGKMNGTDTKMMQIVYTKTPATSDAQSK